MKKMFFKESGEEIKVWNTIVENAEIAPGIIVYNHIIVTNKTIPSLVSQGILEFGEKEIPMELDYYVQKIANKLGWNLKKTYNYLDNVNKISPAAAFSIILKEVALELNDQYKNHIRNSEKIYAISLVNGNIYEMDKTNIETYKNFAAFRSISDAKIALKIVGPLVDSIFDCE